MRILLHTVKVQDMILDDDNPWDGILASTMFALMAMVHTTTSFTPTQLVFGQDTVLHTSRSRFARDQRTKAKAYQSQKQS